MNYCGIEVTEKAAGGQPDRLGTLPIPGSAAFPRDREKGTGLGGTTTQDGESPLNVKVPPCSKEGLWPQSAMDHLPLGGSTFSAPG